MAKDLRHRKESDLYGKNPKHGVAQTLLQQSNIYISMPITEGVSASLFEAMACYCYPIVTDILGNKSWITHRENGGLVAS